MIHASVIGESIVAPTLFRPEFPHSLDPQETLALPQPVDRLSLTTLREKLIQIGANVVLHGRHITFQLAVAYRYDGSLAIVRGDSGGGSTAYHRDRLELAGTGMRDRLEVHSRPHT